jgi:hypothetical protein
MRKMREIRERNKINPVGAAVRSQQADVDHLDVIPAALAERGFGLTAEKMKAVRPKPKKVKPAPPEQPVAVNSRRPQSRTDDAWVNAAFARAEERSKKNSAERSD